MTIPFLVVRFSLHQDVPHGLDVLILIITTMHCFISTCVGVVGISTSTKPDPGITGYAFVFIVRKDTDSCFAVLVTVTLGVKSFPVTVVLQGGLRTNQWLPRGTTQCGVAVVPISDQRVQGVRLLVDDNKLDRLRADLHTEADLGERCVPVGGKLGLLQIKPSLSSSKIKGFFVAPNVCIVVKRLLW